MKGVFHIFLLYIYIYIYNDGSIYQLKQGVRRKDLQEIPKSCGGPG